MNNTQLFTNKAAHYTAARPDYAQSALDYLSSLEIKKGTKVADVGSGTGIFSQQLLDLGAEVYAVEPNDDMRFVAEQNLSSNSYFHSIAAAAEKTSLPDNSMEFITVAQAFHWFDAQLFKKECQRILKKDGLVILAWNSRIGDTVFAHEIKALFVKLCPTYKGISLKEMYNEELEAFYKHHETKRFRNDQKMDEEHFIKRYLSTSYALTPEDEGYENYLEALHNFFHKHAVNGIITEPIETILHIGNVEV